MEAVALYQGGTVAPSSATADIDLNSYHKVLVAFSGGKDSLACLLHLLELGVPSEKIELHHHDVDGHGRNFMDWPITPAYCQAVADHFGIPLLFSFKEGGFEREMLRENARTAPMRWQRLDGSWKTAGGDRGKQTTRRMFPQVSADLRVRWCSAYLKIDVLAAMIRNEPRFLNKRTLVVTGERAQESAARAKYETLEADRADNRYGSRVRRHVDHWRPVHGWDEAKVWDIIRRYGIVPHPAYQLGWGRLSCRNCIFGSDNQWATIGALYPSSLRPIAAYESEFGKTIHRTMRVTHREARGTPYAAAVSQPELAEFANQPVWSGPIVTDTWTIPAGSFGEQAGPC